MSRAVMIASTTEGTCVDTGLPAFEAQLLRTIGEVIAGIARPKQLIPAMATRSRRYVEAGDAHARREVTAAISRFLKERQQTGAQ